MARKVPAKSKTTAGAKAAAARSKVAADEAPKAKTGFGKRSMAAGAARAASTRAKSSHAKAAARPARKSIIGKAVGAVASTVSGVAESATSLFKRGPAKSS
jgi:hypothetical protein